jgi:hypothetical protein
MAACASLSPEQCRNADWRQIGYADGIEGQPGSRIQQHASACASANVAPDLQSYLNGRSEGLIVYCQPEKGFQVGRQGKADNAGDCAPPLRTAFLEQYQKGRQVNGIESELGSLRSSLEQERAQQRRNEERIEEIRKDSRRPNLEPSRRSSLLDEMNRLIERKEDNGRRRLRLQREMDIVQRRLEDTLRQFGR